MMMVSNEDREELHRLVNEYGMGRILRTLAEQAMMLKERSAEFPAIASSWQKAQVILLEASGQLEVL